jgi:hypothetical protein
MLCAQSDGSALVECAHCHTVACDECLGDTAAFCESCSKHYCGACNKLADPAVVVQCARCENWCCAEPCAQDADMLLICGGCPDDSGGKMVMMCEGCREMEDKLHEEFGEWEFGRSPGARACGAPTWRLRALGLPAGSHACRRASRYCHASV